MAYDSLIRCETVLMRLYLGGWWDFDGVRGIDEIMRETLV